MIQVRKIFGSRSGSSRMPEVSTYRNGRRCFASLYAVGEGWTGVFGNGRLDQLIPGHFDNFNGEQNKSTPIRIFNGNIKSCSLGWGHTALVTTGIDKGEHINKLFLSGRPHEFASLLRLYRLPKVLRDYAVRQTLQASSDSEHSGNDFYPVETVGSIVNWLSDALTPGVQDWEYARKLSSIASFVDVDVGLDQTFNHQKSDENIFHENISEVYCSAGFTVLRTNLGCLYAFGLNGSGQCGVKASNNNVWKPTKVAGLSSESVISNHSESDQSLPIVSVALGLQHAVCLNSEGEVFAWGKGDRGQLGCDVLQGEGHTPQHVKKTIILLSGNDKPVYQAMGKVHQIAAGMIHSAALDTENNVYVWGKNVLPNNHRRDISGDAKLPVHLMGLPNHLKVEKIACGSHHTAVLMEDGSVWASGVSSDTKEFIEEAVCLIPPGIIQMPIRQFVAHMDRTTIVGSDGRQILQVSLYKEESLRQLAWFTPVWIQNLLELDESIRVKEVHRSWLHSVAVVE